MKNKAKKENKLFWLYILGGIILVVLAIFLAPVWSNVDVFWKSWGQTVINLIIAFFLSLYLFGFLIKKIIKTKDRTIKVLTIIEFTLLLLIDLYLVLGQIIPSLNIIKVNGACTITGLALWIRGIVEIFRAYFYRGNDETKYPVWWLCIAIAFVSVGMWMLVAPFISDVVISWVLVSLMAVLGLVMIGYGIITKPKTEKKK